MMILTILASWKNGDATDHHFGNAFFQLLKITKNEKY
jgi:hypothetical protein